LYFCLHCLVADGVVRATLTEGGEFLYSVVKSNPN
jgi:hypothetical protein